MFEIMLPLLKVRDEIKKKKKMGEGIGGQTQKIENRRIQKETEIRKGYRSLQRGFFFFSFLD